MSNREWDSVTNIGDESLAYLDKLLKKTGAAPNGQKWAEVLSDKVGSELEELDENLENRSQEYVKDRSLEIYAKRSLAALISLGFFSTDEMLCLAQMYRPLEECYKHFLNRKPEMLAIFQEAIRNCAQEEIRSKSIC